jgi:hypothetical protein
MKWPQKSWLTMPVTVREHAGDVVLVHPNLLNARGVLGVVRGDNNLTTALQQTELMRLSEKIQTLSNAVIGEM